MILSFINLKAEMENDLQQGQDGCVEVWGDSSIGKMLAGKVIYPGPDEFLWHC